MKKHILTLIVCAMALTAHAGNEGPQAIAKPPAVIAQVTTGIVFGPQDGPMSITVDILENGVVQSTQTFRQGQTTVQPLALLSNAALAKLKALVASTTAGKLVSENPQGPGCMDAPSTTYNVIKANGEKIAVAATYACKSLTKQPVSKGDSKIQYILEGLENLNTLF